MRVLYHKKVILSSGIYKIIIKKYNVFIKKCKEINYGTLYIQNKGHLLKSDKL